MLTTREKNALAKKNIINPVHLHRWLPIRYIDNTKETGVSKELDGKNAVFKAVVASVEQKESKNGRGYILIKVIEAQKKMSVNVFVFGQDYYFNSYEAMVGREVLVSGTLAYNPMFGYSVSAINTFSSDPENSMRVLSVFSRIKGLAVKTVERILKDSISIKEPDSVPPEVLKQYYLPEINTAVYGALFPDNMEQADISRKRFLFDDLYYLAARFELEKRTAKRTSSDIKIVKSELTEKIKNELPYSLTKDQEEVYENLKHTLMSGAPLRALIQGDVGCGKTITAFLQMILVAENGYQAAIMAPTKVLAGQHYDNLTKIIENTGLKAVFISGEKINKKDLEKIASGYYQLIVGTHSLISNKVTYNNLGLVVVDEEHKFGVEQREKLKSVNVISMSATPIPRTLAAAVYGENTDIYNIISMPEGRKPVITKYSDGTGISKWVNGILEKGQQVYAVCPAIDTDEEIMPGVLTTQEAEKTYKRLFPDKKISSLNGKMKPKEIEEEIQKFKNGETDILISTTIVEVGVDVPNATLMVIHNAERFGLAGLHQLRGRVGRGKDQSYCLVVSKESPAENKRLYAICTMSNGFEIAEADMKYLRKSGDLFGVQQSGFNRYVEEMLGNPETFKSIQDTVKCIKSEQLLYHIKKVEYCEIKGHMKPFNVSLDH